MKKLLYLFLILIFNSCSGQKAVLDFKQKDIYVFNFVNKNVKSTLPRQKISIKRASASDSINFNLTLNNSEEIYNSKNNIIQTQKKQRNIGINYFEKRFSFIQSKDTMNINCSCGQSINYFFKKIKFIKGDFKLKIEYPKKYNKENNIYEKQVAYISGKEIQDSLKIENILPKKANFISIDMTDFSRVKLLKIKR